MPRRTSAHQVLAAQQTPPPAASRRAAGRAAAAGCRGGGEGAVLPWRMGRRMGSGDGRWWRGAVPAQCAWRAHWRPGRWCSRTSARAVRPPRVLPRSAAQGGRQRAAPAAPRATMGKFISGSYSAVAGRPTPATATRRQSAHASQRTAVNARCEQPSNSAAAPDGAAKGHSRSAPRGGRRTT